MKLPWSSCIGLLIWVLLVLSDSLPVAAFVWQDVAKELMSPACPGRTLINCTSGQSEQWRELIRQKVARGETKSEIVQHFVDMRGEEVLAAPPKKGFALMAWLVPMFVIVNGAGLIVVLTNRWVRQRSAANADSTMGTHTLPQDHTGSDIYRERLRSELEDLEC